MDQPPTSPESMPASEVEMLLYRLQSLFIEWDPKLPGTWGVRRYVDGRRESTFDVNYSPDTGTYGLGVSIKNPLLESGYKVIHGTLTPMGKFLGDHEMETMNETYNERRAKEFNDLLVRSTSKPYGILGRMFLRAMRARYRWAI